MYSSKAQKSLTVSPSNDVCRQREGVYLEFQRKIDKIPTATPIFSGSSFSATADVMGGQRVIEIQDVIQISGSTNNFANFTDIHVVPKTMHGFAICTKRLNFQRSWPTLPRVENPRWQPTNRKY